MPRRLLNRNIKKAHPVRLVNTSLFVPRLKRGKGVANRGRTACSRRLFFLMVCATIDATIDATIKAWQAKAPKDKGFEICATIATINITIKTSLFFSASGLSPAPNRHINRGNRGKPQRRKLSIQRRKAKKEKSKVDLECGSLLWFSIEG